MVHANFSYKTRPATFINTVAEKQTGYSWTDMGLFDSRGQGWFVSMVPLAPAGKYGNCTYIDFSIMFINVYKYINTHNNIITL